MSLKAFKGKVREMEQRLTKLGQEKTKAKETKAHARTATLLCTRFFDPILRRALRQ